MIFYLLIFNFFVVVVIVVVAATVDAVVRKWEGDSIRENGKAVYSALHKRAGI